MHLIAHLIHEYGLIAVAAIVALECVGFPVPGETALLGAAIDAGTKHDLNIGAVIIVADRRCNRRPHDRLRDGT